MPTETTKSAERCRDHPGSPSVALCARCARTLCIACAVPVRGAVLGPECLPPDVATAAQVEIAAGPPMPAWWRATGATLAVLVSATCFAWTRFGTASGWFGAWGTPVRWSTLTAGAGALALLVWVVRRRPGRAATRCVAVLSIAAAAGAILAVLNPPPFTRPSPAPWVAVVAGGLAGAFALVAARRPSV
jgi:peptidoglycan/LPS O-acetylase OafA/YrhL